MGISGSEPSFSLGVPQMPVSIGLFSREFIFGFFPGDEGGC